MITQATHRPRLLPLATAGALWLLGWSVLAAPPVRLYRVIGKDAVLSGLHGQSPLAIGLILTESEPDTPVPDGRIPVRGEVLGQTLSGTVPAEAVERVFLCDGEYLNRAELDRRRHDAGWRPYLGRLRDPEFLRFFHQLAATRLRIANLDSRALTAQPYPKVESVNDLKKLSDGAVVQLSGLLISFPPDLTAVLLANTTFSANDQPALLRRLPTAAAAPRITRRDQQRCTVLACHRPNLERPPRLRDRLVAAFVEITEADCTLTEADFFTLLDHPAGVRFPCPLCHGAGQLADHRQRPAKCQSCRGSGLMTKEATLAEALKAFAASQPQAPR